MNNIDLNELDFTTGADLVTGKCQPCKEGRHLDCRSLFQASPADTYPFFDDDDSSPRKDSGWVCGCLQDATARKNHRKHYGYVE